MNEGWIKLHTKFLNWEWKNEPNMVALFIHLLLKANWKDGRFQGHKVPRGSLVTGRKKLAFETGLTEQQVRTCLKKLKSTSEVTSKSTSGFSIITVNRYDEYQSSNQQTNQRITNEQPTVNQQITTIEEVRSKEVRSKRVNAREFLSIDDFILYASGEQLEEWREALFSNKILNARHFNESMRWFKQRCVAKGKLTDTIGEYQSYFGNSLKFFEPPKPIIKHQTPLEKYG